ncbi:diiron oxygenase [Thiosocius teredinicola]|uniref:diiron oxygenase n=1 Tax=Thiosocius teredinicola TaxID=1973002 RepID=UPI0009911457
MAGKDPETLACEMLNAIRSGHGRTKQVQLGQIDHNKLFLPAEYSQLFYSPIWRDLEPRHQLRYSQLYALRTNEVVVLFERYLVHAILPPIVKRLVKSGYPVLSELVSEMLREEEEHDAAFVALNKASRPDLYADKDFCFFPPSVEIRGFIKSMGLAARWLAHPLWLLFFIEESSLAMARDLGKADADEPLGAAEPNWLAVHQEHTHDERRHTLVDRLVYDTCFASRGRHARTLDARLFVLILKAMMYPRATGAGMRVVDQLILDYPELMPMRPRFAKEIVALRHNPEFLASLLSSRLAPRAWKLFHRCPELDALAGWLPDYA